MAGFIHTPFVPGTLRKCTRRSVSARRPRRHSLNSHSRTFVPSCAAGPSAQVSVQRETCLLVGVDITTKTKHDGERRFNMQESLAELERLVDTAGMEVVGIITQSLPKPIAGTYVGTGKLNEIKQELAALQCCTVVFDVELSPSHQRVLERTFSPKLTDDAEIVKVLDRTAVILSIFAASARTRESKLQTELALCMYRQPRLTRLWTHLGRAGLRGPGELQLEVDRRAIAARIARLSREIEAIGAHRKRQRAARRSNTPLPVVALCGYTNSGKSTLLNSLTGSNAVAEDKLFATLDAKTRVAIMPGVSLSPEILIVDSVGFVQNLPTSLVAAFRSTLEEISSADALVHVIDVSVGTELAIAQMDTVFSVLSEIGADDIPCVLALNKIDAVSRSEVEEVENAIQERSDLDIARISAKSGMGVADLGRLLDDVLRDAMQEVHCVVPYNRGDLVNSIYVQGSVDAEDHTAAGTRLEAYVPKSLAKRLEPYTVKTEATVFETSPYSIDSASKWKKLARKRVE